MLCPHCRRKNPNNTRKCIYCGTPLSTNKKKRDTTDKVILTIIIALFLALVILVSYVLISFSPYHSKGLSSWGGGGGGGYLIENMPTYIGAADISLDSIDPGLEIYSFNVDNREIPIETLEETIFTAEIFSADVLNDNDVAVYDNTESLIGYMNDNGTDGDETANDGIYTLAADLTSTIRQERNYTVRVNNVASNPASVYFYRQITEEEIGFCVDVIERITAITEAGLVIEYLSTNENVDFYSASEDNNFVSYTMKSGISGVWENKETLEGDVAYKGVGATGSNVELLANYTGAVSQVSERKFYPVSPKTEVCVVRPFRNVEDNFNYDDFADAGKLIAKATGGNTDIFDNAKADLEVFMNFDDYGVVLIDSHGTLHNPHNTLFEMFDDDPYICTTSEFTKDSNYSSADWQSGNITLVGNRIAVGAGFFDRYYADNSLVGTSFYLGTCYSMYDNTIFDVLRRKGAEVVYGFTHKVSFDYCNDVLYELVANQHILGVQTSQYAYANTTGVCGKTDPSFRRCEFAMDGYNGYMMVTDVGKGTVSGIVTDASTGEPVKDALVRVYFFGVPVTYARTGDDGQYSFKLVEGEHIIKIDHAKYKTAKAGVTVVHDTTVYVETLLLLGQGITDGYANGIITDAVSGEPVSEVGLKLRKSWNNRDGAVVATSSTNDNGFYEFSLDPGAYTMEYSKGGYITGYKNIVMNVADFYAQNASISPEMPEDGNFRIVLSWSNIPNDLDSHMSGPVGNGERFHIYFRHSDQTNDNPYNDYFRLDLDNTDIVNYPGVPETITIVNQIDGVYRYAVHDFSNKHNTSNTNLSASNATVNVYKGSVLVATFHVPANKTGTVWTVFELSGNQITPINEFGNDINSI